MPSTSGVGSDLKPLLEPIIEDDEPTDEVYRATVRRMRLLR